MNIAEKTALWTQFKFQLPMIICAVWVITTQRKLIWKTLKMWWSWGFSNWPPERINFLKIFGIGAVAFVASSLLSKKRIELETKCQQETVEKMLEEKIITQEDLEKEKQKEAEREREREQRPQDLKKKPVNLLFYNISPFFCFITTVLIAPIVEECVFRYLIFEIFDKNNPLAYIFSGLAFIFLHWTGGVLSFNAIGFLLLGYLPMTIFFIYAYRKSKWNITYPMYFHIFWNFVVFISTVSAAG